MERGKLSRELLDTELHKWIYNPCGNPNHKLLIFRHEQVFEMLQSDPEQQPFPLISSCFLIYTPIFHFPPVFLISRSVETYLWNFCYLVLCSFCLTRKLTPRKIMFTTFSRGHHYTPTYIFEFHKISCYFSIFILYSYLVLLKHCVHDLGRRTFRVFILMKFDKGPLLYRDVIFIRIIKGKLFIKKFCSIVH